MVEDTQTDPLGCVVVRHHHGGDARLLEGASPMGLLEGLLGEIPVGCTCIKTLMGLQMICSPSILRPWSWLMSPMMLHCEAGHTYMWWLAD